MPRTNLGYWPKKRSHGQKFTESEVRIVEACFYAGVTPYALAEKLQCSIRAIEARYSKLRRKSVL
jgi:hypothetical protein